MSSYTAGTLELDVLGMNDSTAISIERTAKALGSLNRILKSMNGVSYGAQVNKLTRFFDKLALSTNALNENKLKALADIGKSFRGITSISKLDKVDYAKVGEGFSKLTVAITPFINKVQEAEVSLSALYGILNKAGGKRIHGILNGGGASSKGRGVGLSGFAKLGISVYSMRRLAHFGAQLVQAGSDYYETLNLWQVAMRGNNDLADEFVTKMNKAYGISTKTLMNAQAIFRNMLGSLGQIPDDAAYKISEALVQMSADFSSLYNVKIEQAFSKMQSMLAGQVRPIRSAGLDMTETTLFIFYQQLGGTKTMRQLNRTEKQLLSILAVYRQMGRAGALGDMTKTLNQFANQTRMMTEYWAELKSWTGLILKDLIEQSGVMIYINASLITMTEIIKAIAKSKGLGEENFIDGMFETTEATNDEIDELQGKLLDFDKFRALEDNQASPLAIDEKLLEAIAGYSSMIDQAENNAQKLAETWLKFWINEETGGLTEDAERVLGVLEGLVKFGTILIGLKIGTWIIGLVKGIGSLTIASKGLHNILVAGVIYAIWEAIDAFKEGDVVTGVIALTIGVALVGALVAFKLAQHKASLATQMATLAIKEQNVLALTHAVTMEKSAVSIKSVGVALLAMVASYGVASSVINQFEGTGKKIASWAFIVVGAITAVTASILAMNSVISWGTALPVLLAGVGAAVAGVQGLMPKVEMHAMGASDIDGGTLFVAGEMGKTEAVYTGSNGKTNVANVRQMEQAFYNALSRHTAEGNDKIVVQAYLDGEKVYENTTSRAKARGKVWAKA